MQIVILITKLIVILIAPWASNLTSVDKFISEKVEAEISQIAEEKQSLANDRVKYTKAISEHAKVLDKFVTELLTQFLKYRYLCCLDNPGQNKWH